MYRLITKWESSMFLTKKWYCLGSAVLSDVSYYWAGWNKKRSKSQTSSDDDLQSMMNEQHLLLSSRNTSIVLRKIAVATPRFCKLDPTELYLYIIYFIISSILNMPSLLKYSLMAGTYIYVWHENLESCKFWLVKRLLIDNQLMIKRVSIDSQSTVTKQSDFE